MRAVLAKSEGRMSSLRTPYQVLNVTPDAEGVVIEAAYKALIKKYHPDHWVGDRRSLLQPDTRAARR